jgi:hypothetical protein
MFFSYYDSCIRRILTKGKIGKTFGLLKRKILEKLFFTDQLTARREK